MLASDLASLHALVGDSTLFLDETGTPINGQWAGSPGPNQHDILTGSDPGGMLQMSATTGNPANCADWTSAGTMADGFVAQVGHSDGLGPMMNAAAPLNSWNSSHESAGCDDTVPRGGAGRLYCCHYAVRAARGHAGGDVSPCAVVVLHGAKVRTS